MNIKQLIKKLKTKNCLVFMTITGGGTRAISMLLENGGASDVFVGAEVPYSYDIGSKPEHYVSEAYSDDLSIYSFKKIDKYFAYNQASYNFIGVGVSAALAKTNERVGRLNHAYISFDSQKYETTHYVNLDKIYGRKNQEDELALQILQLLDSFISFFN